MLTGRGGSARHDREPVERLHRPDTDAGLFAGQGQPLGAEGKAVRVCLLPEYLGTLANGTQSADGRAGRAVPRRRGRSRSAWWGTFVPPHCPPSKPGQHAAAAARYPAYSRTPTAARYAAYAAAEAAAEAAASGAGAGESPGTSLVRLVARTAWDAVLNGPDYGR